MNKQFIMLTAFMFATPYTMHAMKTPEKFGTMNVSFSMQGSHQDDPTNEEIVDFLKKTQNRNHSRTPSPTRLRSQSINSLNADTEKNIKTDRFNVYDFFKESNMLEERPRSTTPELIAQKFDEINSIKPQMKAQIIEMLHKFTQDTENYLNTDSLPKQNEIMKLQERRVKFITMTVAMQQIAEKFI